MITAKILATDLILTPSSDRSNLDRSGIFHTTLRFTSCWPPLKRPPRLKNHNVVDRFLETRKSVRRSPKGDPTVNFLKFQYEEPTYEEVARADLGSKVQDKYQSPVQG